jgi:hypothetical protein
MFLLGLRPLLSAAAVQVQKRKTEQKRKEEPDLNAIKIRQLQEEIRLLESNKRVSFTIEKTRIVEQSRKDGVLAMRDALQSMIDAKEVEINAAQAVLAGKQDDLDVSLSVIEVTKQNLETDRNALEEALEAWPGRSLSASAEAVYAAVALLLTYCDGILVSLDNQPTLAGDESMVSATEALTWSATLAEVQGELDEAIEAWGTSDATTEAVALRAAAETMRVRVVSVGVDVTAHHQVASDASAAMSALEALYDDMDLLRYMDAELLKPGARTDGTVARAAELLQAQKRKFQDAAIAANRAAMKAKNLAG